MDVKPVTLVRSVINQTKEEEEREGQQQRDKRRRARWKMGFSANGHYMQESCCPIYLMFLLAINRMIGGKCKVII